MITLFQFAPAFGLPNASPSCMEGETYLRMAGLSYECLRDADLRKAPKGRLPYIEDDEVVVADSGFIVDHLKRKYGDPLDAHLGAADFLGDKPFSWARNLPRWTRPRTPSSPTSCGCPSSRRSRPTRRRIRNWRRTAPE